MRLKFLFFLSISSFFALPLCSQTVSVGAGSYTTNLPAGATGPRNSQGAAVPKITDDFAQKVQTNDFWSSLIFPRVSNQWSGRLFAHPLVMEATNNGMLLGYPKNTVVGGARFGNFFETNVKVVLDGLSSDKTEVSSYGDWTVSTVWDDGEQRMKATLGHGLPYVFFEMDGGDALVEVSGASVWHNENGVLGVTVNGSHYAFFAPSGSSWTSSAPYRTDLNGKNYLSAAILPDTNSETLALFKNHAYAHVTDSRVTWSYDESTAKLTNTFSYVTELKEDGNGLVNETLTALYRHQWLYATTDLTSYSYNSPRGEMKLSVGNEFITEHRFSGILPSMPVLGDYDETTLNNYVNSESNTTLGVESTYWSGVDMGRLAELTHIAHQTGNESAMSHFLNQLKTRLQEWFTAGGPQQYYYNDEWDLLTGYPAGFGSDTEINDHHFHSSYAIRSAATIAQYDPAWASQEQWGRMVNMLIRDANSWDREDPLFPFLRAFDAYAGHSWAAGHGDFPEGNNQESSSEAINFASSVFLWGTATGQTEIRDLGIFLHANEVSAIEQYWFDVDDVTFPDNYPHNAVGIVWGAMGNHTTWFGGDPEFIHGINYLPLNGGSFYLGKYPDYVIENYEEVVRERGSKPVVWKDIMCMYLALGDADRAVAEYEADPNYSMTRNESRAQTYTWLKSLEAIGQVETEIWADVPQYAVFRNKSNELTYLAYNSTDQSKTVTFSDGYSMLVEAGELKSSGGQNVAVEEPNAPKEFTLNQNYPNPFNPTTNISFNLPEATNVEVTIYSAIGQQISSLDSGFYAQGNHTLTWNAENLPSGVYFYRLSTDSFTQTKQMLLLK